ncbi:LysR substrate-binding domain-containing protein [Pseudoduganella namucuonensis]|uniref:DNA-binding transcriptional regulator, LysR family n=1 Tax=Pseudoduganella namucuonensis TaxID=1035707 RepID=A0A1I7JN74_9BURK|nr:LysR substrate-binding domain-containing protein [Pseudoduganella namucuonensis]SFU86631.1 DNA-binding transcriptional regulator, LysR family [Pseudoduganella namucuonensis]
MLRLSLEALQIVDAIDRRGSFSAAGKELHRVPSTISYTVAKLEDDLGVQVFERNGPRVELTRAGQELLKEGRYLLKAALDLEHRVRRVASGWETELAVGIDSMFPALSFSCDVSAFYEVAQQTRLRIVQEALSGTWEALLDRRVDLLVGAPGDGPAGGGYVSEPMGTMRFVFAVAPGHPLASAEGTLGRNELQHHRAVVMADSARRMAPRTVGLLLGQDSLTVPTMQSKYEFQLAGLGFGFLPEHCARAAIAAGLLVEKAVEEPKPDETFYLAWRTGEQGAALSWWLERMRRPGVFERLCRYLPGNTL